MNYLYTQFLEETDFAQAVNTSPEASQALIAARVFPAPSYVHYGSGRCVSFVSDFVDDAVYRFHLRGHTGWYEMITRLGLTTEDRARFHFFNRYNAAKRAFLDSDLGRALIGEAPDIPDQFDADHATSTWGHFLTGVYGVCTRDGQPETIFLKQVGVMFIERMIAGGPGSVSDAQLVLLKRAVAFLDEVESDFAPHEVPQTSRQRCIVDVRATFFGEMAG